MIPNKAIGVPGHGCHVRPYITIRYIATISYKMRLCVHSWKAKIPKTDTSTGSVGPPCIRIMFEVFWEKLSRNVYSLAEIGRQTDRNDRDHQSIAPVRSGKFDQKRAGDPRLPPTGHANCDSPESGHFEAAFLELVVKLLRCLTRLIFNDPTIEEMDRAVGMCCVAWIVSNHADGCTLTV